MPPWGPNTCNTWGSECRWSHVLPWTCNSKSATPSLPRSTKAPGQTPFNYAITTLTPHPRPTSHLQLLTVGWRGGGAQVWKPSHAPAGALLDATTIALLDTKMQISSWGEHNTDKLLSQSGHTSESNLGRATPRWWYYPKLCTTNMLQSTCDLHVWYMMRCTYASTGRILRKINSSDSSIRPCIV